VKRITGYKIDKLVVKGHDNGLSKEKPRKEKAGQFFTVMASDSTVVGHSMDIGRLFQRDRIGFFGYWISLDC
jgi:hypothetical protein